MLSLWKKWTGIGVSVTQTLAQNKQVRLLNQIVSILLFGVLFRLVMDIMDADWQGVTVLTIMSSCFLLTFIFQYFKYFKIAKSYFVTIFVLLMTAMVMIMGRELGAEFGFFTSVIMVLTFFDNRKNRAIFFIGTIICYAISQWYIANYDSPLSSSLTPASFHFMFLANGICTVLMTQAFVNQNEAFSKQTLELLEDVKEKNKSLKSQQSHIANQNKRLESTNKELERFAFVASHDLKTPLRNINSFLQLIKRRLKKRKTENEEVIEYLEFATKSAQQMHYLIEDILEYSRLNKKGLQAENTDLNELVDEIKDNLKAFFTDENAIIEVDNLPTIYGVKSQLRLLFQNLIENAIKYNEQISPLIQIECIDLGAEYQISVTDNGIGIEAQYSKQIFEMFTRLHNQEHYQGSGVGLAICQKIANHHGGFIELESELGQGSTFKIHFPKQINMFQVEKNNQVEELVSLQN